MWDVIDTEVNPWQDIRSIRSSYVLNQDLPCLHENEQRKKNLQIIEGSIPEPFLGSPEKATVILLALNPGHSEDDQKCYRNSVKFREAIFANLRHEGQRYPFYPLNPEFRNTPVAGYWMKRTRVLREALGRHENLLAERLMVVEWFPYHSINFDANKHSCDSQAYSHRLVQKLKGAGKLIIGLRGKKQWDTVVSNIPYLRSPQSTYITPRNLSENLFGTVLNRVRYG